MHYYQNPSGEFRLFSYHAAWTWLTCLQVGPFPPRFLLELLVRLRVMDGTSSSRITECLALSWEFCFVR
jgi:hypothetical protein